MFLIPFIFCRIDCTTAIRPVGVSSSHAGEVDHYHESYGADSE